MGQTKGSDSTAEADLLDIGAAGLEGRVLRRMGRSGPGEGDLAGGGAGVMPAAMEIAVELSRYLSMSRSLFQSM